MQMFEDKNTALNKLNLFKFANNIQVKNLKNKKQ